MDPETAGSVRLKLHVIVKASDIIALCCRNRTLTQHVRRRDGAGRKCRMEAENLRSLSHVTRQERSTKYALMCSLGTLNPSISFSIRVSLEMKQPFLADAGRTHAQRRWWKPLRRQRNPHRRATTTL